MEFGYILNVFHIRGAYSRCILEAFEEVLINIPTASWAIKRILSEGESVVCTVLGWIWVTGFPWTVSSARVHSDSTTTTSTHHIHPPQLDSKQTHTVSKMMEELDAMASNSLSNLEDRLANMDFSEKMLDLCFILDVRTFPNAFLSHRQTEKTTWSREGRTPSRDYQDFSPNCFLCLSCHSCSFVYFFLWSASVFRIQTTGSMGSYITVEHLAFPSESLTFSSCRLGCLFFRGDQLIGSHPEYRIDMRRDHQFRKTCFTRMFKDRSNSLQVRLAPFFPNILSSIWLVHSDRRLSFGNL